LEEQIMAAVYEASVYNWATKIVSGHREVYIVSKSTYNSITPKPMEAV
jgi:hypothetical protein